MRTNILPSKTQIGIILSGICIAVLAACSSLPKSASHVEKTGAAGIPAPTAITSQTLRANRIDAILQKFVSQNLVPGLSVVVYEKGVESYYGQAGMRDREARISLNRSDVGRYYSMTKPIIGIGLMMLFEDGLFGLDDPIAKYLPEYADLKVYAGKNPDGSMQLTTPKRAVTIRDLMRHTAGMSYGSFSDTPVDKAYRNVQLLRRDETLAQFSQKMGKLPLLVEPGEKWIYSVAVDVQARLIEVLSGQTIGAYLRENIFQPLDMSHTGFVVKPADKDKFGPAYVVDKSSGAPVLIRLTDQNVGTITRGAALHIDNIYLNKQALESGGGGLVSTLDDYVKFAKMLRGHGTGNGNTLIKPKTLALMHQDHLRGIDNGRLDASLGFGLDFAVKIKQIDDPLSLPLPTGSYFWGGLAGTYFWIDPTNDIFTVMHMQFINPLDPSIRNAVVGAVYGK